MYCRILGAGEVCSYITRMCRRHTPLSYRVKCKRLRVIVGEGGGGGAALSPKLGTGHPYLPWKINTLWTARSDVSPENYNVLLGRGWGGSWGWVEGGVGSSGGTKSRSEETRLI